MIRRLCETRRFCNLSVVLHYTKTPDMSDTQTGLTDERCGQLLGLKFFSITSYSREPDHPSWVKYVDKIFASLVSRCNGLLKLDVSCRSITDAMIFSVTKCRDLVTIKLNFGVITDSQMTTISENCRSLKDVKIEFFSGGVDALTRHCSCLLYTSDAADE